MEIGQNGGLFDTVRNVAISHDILMRVVSDTDYAKHITVDRNYWVVVGQFISPYNGSVRIETHCASTRYSDTNRIQFVHKRGDQIINMSSEIYLPTNYVTYTADFTNVQYGDFILLQAISAYEGYGTSFSQVTLKGTVQ